MPKFSDQCMQDFLQLLRSGFDSGYISGQLLASRSGISRSAVWKKVRLLRRQGYQIESAHGLGYRLMATTTFPVSWELQKELDTNFVGKNIVYSDKADSTQRIALSMAEKRLCSNGTVVLAELQSAGRGRLSRKWISPKGGIWMSVILEPEIPTSMITILSLGAALSVCRAIRQYSKLDAKLKWPNDIMISRKKVAGILLDISAEAERINYAVIGIGVNANIDPSIISKEIKGAQPVTKITSIRSELGEEVDRLQLTKVILESLEQILVDLNERGRLPIIEAWKMGTDMIGKKVQVLQNKRVVDQGTAIDIDVDGSLLLRKDDGDTMTISFGDVRVRY